MASPDGETQLPARRPARAVPALQIAPQAAAVAPAPPAVDAGFVGEAIDVRKVLGVLRRNLWLILAITAVTVGLAWYLASRAEPEYRAKVVLRFKDQRHALTGGIADATVEKALGVTADPFLSQIQLLNSRKLIGAVVDREHLRLRLTGHGRAPGLMRVFALSPQAPVGVLTLRFLENDYIVDPGKGHVRAPYGQPVEIAGARFSVMYRPAVETALLQVQSRGAAIDRVSRSLRAEPRQRTDVLDLTFTANDPVRAQAVVNAVATVYREQNTLEVQQQARSRREFVGEQLAETDGLLAQAQQALSNFQTREGVFSSEQQFQAQQTGKMELDIRQEELAADREMYQRLLNTLQRGGGPGERAGLRTIVSAPGIASNPVISQLYTQLVSYETTRDTLLAGEWGRSRTSPQVQRLDTLIAATQGRLVDAVRSHIEALDARLTSVRGLVDRNSAELRTLPGRQAEEARLVRGVEVLQQMADQLREELQRARIAEAVEAGQVEIVDLAEVPDAPLGSGRNSRIVLGLLLGLILGSGAAAMREQVNTAVKEPSELEALLQVPALGVVPRLTPGHSRVSRLRLPGWLRRGAVEVEDANGRAKALVMVHSPRSSGAEAFRTLRTNVLFSQVVRELRVLAVTSTFPAEGKSMTSANVATAFAQQGMRVLLVDCDLRRPVQHTMFGVPQEPGLTGALLGEVPLSEAVRPTEIPGLSILTGGTLPPNPSELLGGHAMDQLLSRLEQEFDLVVIDTPPIHAASDAVILGTRVDGVMLVVRAARTGRAEARRSVQQLQAVGAHVVGAVLNDPDAQIPSYGGYGYGGYGYGYGHGYYGENGKG